MKLHLRFRSCLLTLLIAGMATSASAHCLRYEPETVSITGKLHRQTFPGPPNYESVAGGDAPETGFYLTLDTAICTVADAAHDQAAFASVKEIQLVLNDKLYKKLRPKLGTSIRLRGQLFAGFTGHHHTDVLLQVSD